MQINARRKATSHNVAWLSGTGIHLCSSSPWPYSSEYLTGNRPQAPNKLQAGSSAGPTGQQPAAAAQGQQASSRPGSATCCQAANSAGVISSHAWLLCGMAGILGSAKGGGSSATGVKGLLVLTVQGLAEWHCRRCPASASGGQLECWGPAVRHKVAGCRRLAGKLADTQAASTKPLALYGFLQALRQPSGTHGGSGSQPVKAVLAAASSGSSGSPGSAACAKASRAIGARFASICSFDQGHVEWRPAAKQEGAPLPGLLCFLKGATQQATVKHQRGEQPGPYLEKCNANEAKQASASRSCLGVG
ncbi:hypothetical protein WJX72_012450 [[Myrmecia] bisecta]|uniref:Uncharacterized protein n=1 Tax=[Myrmecia] bisecta TaxID=41462 RepID=A0AAW1QAG0_9CHLO